MNRMILPMCILISFMEAQQPIEEKPKENNFLEVKVNDPDLQREINALRVLFDSDLQKLKQKHKEEKRTLRRSYKGKLKALRKKAKEKRKLKKRPGN